MRKFAVLIVLFALQGLSDAVTVKNESEQFYLIFAFGVYIPLILVFVGIAFIVIRYSGYNPRGPVGQVPPPPPPPPLPTTPKTNRAVKVPPYWTRDSNSTDPVFVIDLTEFDMEPIKTLVYSLWEPQEVGIGRDAQFIKDKCIHIRQVYRVQNKALFQKYLEFKTLMEKKEDYISYFKDLEESLNRAPVQTTAKIQETPILKYSYLEHDSVEHKYNEHYLFHGTKSADAQSVCRKGLCTYFAKDGLYGTGVYTAENPTKSDQYTDKTPTNNTLLLVRVCLGEIFVLRNEAGAKQLRSAPCVECCKFNCHDTTHRLKFDSVVTDVPGRRYREFVVYRDYRTYPEYIINYDRVPDDTEMKKYI